MIEGNWKVALYVDERADRGSSEALSGDLLRRSRGHDGRVRPVDR